MRVGMILLCLVPAHVYGGQKQPVCVVAAERTMAVQEKTRADGSTGYVAPPNDAAIVALQKAYLKKFSVRANCDADTIKVGVRGVGSGVHPRAASGGFAVDGPRGVATGGYSGSGTDSSAAFFVELGLPHGNGKTTLVCGAPNREKAAQSCVKQTQEWLKLQDQLR